MKNIIRWDPLRAVRTFDPFDEMRTMQRDMDRLFGRLLGMERQGETGHAVLWAPPVESYTKDGKIIIKAELPGVDVKDLDLSITERELVIRGERKAEKDAQEKDFTYREISYGSFERRFLLPEGVKAEDLKAAFVNGVLEVTIPVPEAPKARKIEVKAGEPKKLEAETTAKKVA